MAYTLKGFRHNFKFDGYANEDASQGGSGVPVDHSDEPEEQITEARAQIERLRRRNEELANAVDKIRQEKEKLQGWLTEMAQHQAEFAEQATSLLDEKQRAGDPLESSERFIQRWTHHFTQLTSTKRRESLGTVTTISKEGD